MCCSCSPGCRSGITWFTVLVTAWSVTLSLVITPLVIPLAMALGALVRACASVEAAVAREALGVRVYAPHRPLVRQGLFRRAFGWLSDPAMWRAQGYLAYRAVIGFGPADQPAGRIARADRGADLLPLLERHAQLRLLARGYARQGAAAGAGGHGGIFRHHAPRGPAWITLPPRGGGPAREVGRPAGAVRTPEHRRASPATRSAGSGLRDQLGGDGPRLGADRSRLLLADLADPLAAALLRDLGVEAARRRESRALETTWSEPPSAYRSAYR
jgi:Putative sensor